MSTDFRALCAAMSSWWGLLSLPKEARPQDQAMFDELGRQVGAALAAEPVGEGPPPLPSNYIDPEHQGEDMKVLQVFYRACNAEGGTADEIHLRGIRAVLAARPAAPPAPEVGQVATELQELAEACDGTLAMARVQRLFTRAATLLQQLSAPAPVVVPVAVSERLPEPGDCDVEGRCWWSTPPACGPHKIRPCWTFDSEIMEGDTHWLPAHAIPLPQAGEGGKVIPSNEQVDTDLDRFRPKAATNSKPPFGLRPIYIADHMRAIEIHEAIGRVLGSSPMLPELCNKFGILHEWVDEFAEIINRYQPKP